GAGPVSSMVVRRIGQLVTNSETAGTGSLGVLERAALVVEDGSIAWVGPDADAPAADSAYDADGGTVIPGFVDSHNHLVFGGDRSAEFAARMAGRPYQAGGIRTTVAATRDTDDDALRRRTRALARQAAAQGTTTWECKSGYG